MNLFNIETCSSNLNISKNRTERFVIDLLAQLMPRFEEYGLRVDAHQPRKHDAGYDLDLVLSRGGFHQAFAMQLKARPTLSNLSAFRMHEIGEIPLLVGASAVSPRSADGFRRAGIQFIDAAGNASIRFGDVLIDVRGRRAGIDPSLLEREKGGNLFSRARSQVAFVLLQWPRLWRRSQRELAEAAGVSVGHANDAVRMFRQSGFGPGGHRSDAELVDLWVAAFPKGLATKLTLATYRGSVEEFRKVIAEAPVFPAGAAISGELAADDRLRPAALTIYVPELDPTMPVKNRWRLEEGGNITVRHKFWTTPSSESHDTAGLQVGKQLAPALLVYADLMASDDPRVRSVAPEWRRDVARPELDR
ncbi:MAG: type IV toxin-antitoxin system AbiEi family antitoxin [Nocardioides sp.]